MATATYIALANYTMPSATSTVTFSNIPATYRDLVLIINGKTSSASTENLLFEVNADSTAGNYSGVRMLGDGSSATSASTGRVLGDVNNAIFTTIAHFMDYSATDKHKTVLSRTGNASAYLGAYAARWANTNAITSIVIKPLTANLDTGTTLSLYGIAS